MAPLSCSACARPVRICLSYGDGRPAEFFCSNACLAPRMRETKDCGAERTVSLVDE